jgi:hypothetical protein
MNIINDAENIDKLLSLGVTDEEINCYTDDSGSLIDISPFIFSYTEANWFDDEGFHLERP